VKRWNFRKADWKRFCFLTGESVEICHLRTHQTLRGHTRIFARAYYLRPNNVCIPRGRRENYMSCWDKECETPYRSFIRAPVGADSERASSLLLSRLEQKKQERWEESVNSTDFSHSSRKAWRTINKLTGRSGRSSRLCPVSANSIASQLVKNGEHRTGIREFTRLVNK